MANHRVKTVTQGAWCVSTETGTGIDGAILKVFILRENMPTRIARGVTMTCRFQRGDADGKRFPSVEAAFAYALDHGYCQKFYRKAWRT